MEMRQIVNILIVAFILGGVIIFVISLRNTDEVDTGKDFTSTALSPDAEVTISQLILLLNQVESLTFDTSIFDRDVYNNLTDFTVKIKPEQRGVVSPFGFLSE